MISYRLEDLTQALHECGLTRGDTVFVHSRLFALGLLEGCGGEQNTQGFLTVLRSVVGEEGTIVVPTYTTYTARYGIPFHLESSPGRTGALAELVRLSPGSVRSLHPISSVGALGGRANEICDNLPPLDYGCDSAFHRMVSIGAIALIAGMPVLGDDPMEIASTSWHHYLEAVCGLPYMYNKLLDVEVYAGGKRIDRPFFASVRYVHIDVRRDWRRLHRRLIERGSLRSARVGAGWVHAVSAADYCSEGLELLKEDPFGFLLRRPSFPRGQVPFDGPTAGRDGVPLDNTHLAKAGSGVGGRPG